MGVGWHIWHNNSFSPIYRAEQDLSELSKYSDFLKMVMYHNCGGERMASYIESVGQTIYGDISKQLLLDFEYSVMNYRGHGIEEIAYTGPVERLRVTRDETRPARPCGKTTQIWPGIDIDIPTADNQSKSTPQGTKDAVSPRFEAGAPGVFLSRSIPR